MSRYINTYWCAPSISLMVFLADMASIFMQLFPAPYYLSLIWFASVAGHITVVFYQLYTRTYNVAGRTAALLVVPIFCFWFMANGIT